MKNYSFKKSLKNRKQRDTYFKQLTMKFMSFNLLKRIEHSNTINTLFNHTVGIIMKKGKKTKAQKQLENAFLYIKQKTNTNPHFIFSKAIEKTSPLIKLISTKKGSKSIKIPVPLNEYQQHRKAIIWILEASNKRHNRNFSERLAQELIAVVDGTSSVFQRKEQLHKLALVRNFSNLTIINFKLDK
ncbi:unnamed protein product [Pneumocystis jirovecii]|uniref:Small ribosomal subunit protein uS7 domain-containing protein n=1 Tax=Pneumocystis jirovecii TaxID=42068 RepID=L0P8D1_PNEJI|nr:unnamed protein product [Pneumocystis jirovecii]